MTTRRNLLQLMSVSGAGLLAGAVRPAHAQHTGHGAPQTPEPAVVNTQTPATRATAGYRPVQTLNGWTLPYRVNAGAKEFHLVAEEIDHEFAPGSRAKCWG